MKASQMQAMVATAYGGPEVFELQSVDLPQPGPEEVCVRIYASSVTRADTMLRTGKPYFARLMLGLRRPKDPIPGTGFAGIITGVGSEVDNFRVGEEVFGETTLGFSTNAEYVVVPAKGIMLPKPFGLPFNEAAALCDGGLTSLNFLREIAQIKVGQKVLIIGASGSLGTAAVQLAKYYGAQVTGVCSTRNIGLVKSLGADQVVDYTKTDFTRQAQQYDIIFDTVGVSSFSAVRNNLRPKGQYLSPVIGLRVLWDMLRTQLGSGKQAKFAATGLKSDDELRTLLRELIVIYQEGKLKTIIDRQFPLAKLAEAHAFIDQGHKVGNVVVRMTE